LSESTKEEIPSERVERINKKQIEVLERRRKEQRSKTKKEGNVFCW
jgi:hypothetical protein